MKFDIVTIFPKIFKPYFLESLIGQAQKKGLIDINIHDLRDWTEDKHKSVDGRPFGGGLGMVMKVKPIFRAAMTLKKSKVKSQKSKVVLFSPRGKKFNQKIATQFSKLDQLILICGRYEGIDERVAKNIADVELSIGDYVLMGGELPAMVVVETVSILIPGVIGKPQLLKERITKSKGFTEYPQYTRPEVFAVPAEARGAKAGAKKNKYWRVPKVLLSGNHKKIEEWREKHKKIIE